MAQATFRSDDTNTNTLARFPAQVRPKVTEFVAGDTTTAKQITTTETAVLGTRVDKILLSTNDAATVQHVNFYLHDGTTLSTLPFAWVPLPQSSGTDGLTIPVSALRSTEFQGVVELDNNGNPYIMLGVGWSIYAAMGATINGTDTVQISAWGHDY